MNPSRKKHLNHQKPDWVGPEAIYFITIALPRKQNHLCLPLIAPSLIQSFAHYNEQGTWYCYLALLMPDHLHLLLSLAPDKTLSQTISLWKRWSAKEHGLHWQINFFDHRLRQEDNLIAKSDYILQNPVRAGLIKRAQDWPYFWQSHSHPTAAGTAAATFQGPLSLN